MAVEVVILAAGLGKRMHSRLPKVLHPIAGKPMLMHLLETVAGLEPQRIHIVVGHGSDQVVDCIGDGNPLINWVDQPEQRGTGHAVLQALPHIQDNSEVVILNGDTPLLALETLVAISRPGEDLRLLVDTVDNPAGMGRIMRDQSGTITGIVEEKDASEEQKRIREVNSNCIGVRVEHLGKWLPEIECDNVQKEVYLTDAVACAVAAGVEITAVAPSGTDETLGANSKLDLERIERVYQRKRAERLMADGVTIIDGNRLDIRGTCQFGNDCVLDINVILEGNVVIGDRVRIGPNTLLRNTSIGDDCVVEANTVIDTATVGKRCNIGPFARIRPETVLGDEVRIGNFVETKKSEIGERSKVNHLSYVGDSEVGENVNIGAGVITCNYDGANKHKTVIGNDVFVGSDSQLVAPVSIGDGATIGAGSTITSDVDSDKLAVSRARQRAVSGWQRPEKKT
jgi:bifunctional UDP-N-acetylglucosamine pyrophosphorylase/glucosamine-1-phosphate N-acetyltransferase